MPSLAGAAVTLYLTGVVAVTNGAPFVNQTSGFVRSLAVVLVAGFVSTNPPGYSLSLLL